MKSSFGESGPDGGRGLSFGSNFLTVMVATALVVGGFLLNAPPVPVRRRRLSQIFFTGNDIGTSI